MNNANEIDSTIFNKSEWVMNCIMLYDDKFLKDEVNLIILNATTDFVLFTDRFDEPIFSFEFTGVFHFIHDHKATILQF